MINKIKTFISGAIYEVLYKVTWPSYKSLQNSSILVLIASLIFAALISALDFAIRNRISWFYNDF
jgi:preprotein translocase subunit SecE